MKLTRNQKNQQINLSTSTFHTKVLEKSQCEEEILHKKTMRVHIVAFADLFRKD